MVMKIKGALWFGVIAVVGVLAVTQLHIFGGPGEPLRVHTPTKTAVQRAQTVRFYAAWTRPHTPTVITYWIGSVMVQLHSWQLPGQAGSWHRDVPYDPKVGYILTVDQGISDKQVVTDCEVTLIPAGFSDVDRVHGRGDAKCWINPGV